MRGVYNKHCLLTFFILQLYFIWVTGSQRHFEWLLDILQEVEDVDTHGMVSIDIFITQFFQNFDLRTAMLVSIQIMLSTTCNVKVLNQFYSPR